MFGKGSRTKTHVYFEFALTKKLREEVCHRKANSARPSHVRPCHLRRWRGECVHGSGSPGNLLEAFLGALCIYLHPGGIGWVWNH